MPAGPVAHWFGHLASQRCLSFDLLSEQIAGEDLRNREAMPAAAGMGALARSGRPEEHQLCEVVMNLRRAGHRHGRR
jgi:hypothetical protein